MQTDLPRRVPGRALANPNLAKHVQNAVDKLPPLTHAQRARLAALLRPIGAKPGGED